MASWMAEAVLANEGALFVHVASRAQGLTAMVLLSWVEQLSIRVLLGSVGSAEETTEGPIAAS